MTASDWVLLGGVLLSSFFAWSRFRTLSRRRTRVGATDSEVGQVARLDYFPRNWTGSESADSFGWDELFGKPTGLYVQRAGLFAKVRCDPVCQQRICLSTLSFWRVRPEAQGGDRPLAPTPAELFDIVEAMLAVILAAELTPTLVVIEPAFHFESLRQWLEDTTPRLALHLRENKTAFEWRRIEVLPFLDRQPFGEDLVTRLAARLRSGHGSLSYGHKYYCGHGLSAEAGAICLRVYEDGLDGEVLTTWADEQSFIADAANWSDYVCSGADPEAPLFKAQDDFYLANQRITRERIEEYLAEEAQPPR
jgi:hypothetical protein